jgi:anthranilate synthase/aminodeoxychorismate synthase-like glutamine amidotransferase
MILIIDNYDSFVYNIYQYICEIEPNTQVIRNDAISLSEIEKMRPSHIVLSPGPKTPAEAGISIELVKRFYSQIPILGICLGHQAIAAAFGGKIVPTDYFMHGKSSELELLEPSAIFKGLEKKFSVGRYHSLVIEKDTLPSCFKLTATSNKAKVIMAIEHREAHLFGVQFHPESILSEHGKTILKNFLSIKQENH